MAFASPWCAQFYDKTLVEGRDYLQTIAYAKGDLARGKNVQITWRWPLVRSPKCGVFGIPHIAWGNYDSGAVYSPVAPRQVFAINDLTVAYEVEDAAGYAKGVQGYNGLAEFYLTKVAGDANTKAIEIGWFWNTPKETRDWMLTGRQLGVWKDRFKQSWRVSVMKSGVAGTFATFSPNNATGRDVKGMLDAKGAIAFLQAAGIVQPSWWFNGIGIGVEPLGGTGTVLVREFTPTLN
jgi:hypothetical protein